MLIDFIAECFSFSLLRYNVFQIESLMKVVAVVVTVIGVPPLNEIVLLTGLVTAEKKVVVPALLVMRASLKL